MKSYKIPWIIFAVLITVAFTILGYYGMDVYHQAPPVPERFVSENGDVVYSKDDIYTGQKAWQSIGGMEIGTVWGHGAYQAPDWTADWLHREATEYMNLTAQAVYHKPYAELSPEQQQQVQYRVQTDLRKNTLQENGEVILPARRIAAIKHVAQYYDKLFGNAPEYKKSREAFAMKENTLPEKSEREKLAGFFFWSSWAASTNRPGQEVTYTNNWPHEPLINNVPTAENVLWSVISVVVLLLGTGLLIWCQAFFGHHDEKLPEPPAKDPLSLVHLTPSQRALGKYLFIVVALFCFQVLLGGFTAHYTVEGQQFYGWDISQWFPYSLVRTWHIQSAIFWIATAFLSAGLFLVPIINGGKDPRWQKLGVDILFWALIVVVAGSFLGQFTAIKGWMPLALNFWFGHQGYEFVELGRFWQIALYIGLIFWLILMLRGVWAGLKASGDKSLLFLLTIAIGAIGLFYGSGLFYGANTNLSIMEYWRWWIVHLWVEGFFEVFATAATAFIFCSLGLVNLRTATVACILSATLFMIGGIPGTFHHLYFSGTSTPILAVGAIFSAMEVIPLTILGYEAYEHWHLRKRAPWMENMKWPLMCFIAVAFWNMLGAGVFGFLINPPISLYYVQGLNTTANHGHAALFGVYGFLSIGFVLMVLRYIRPSLKFNDTLMATVFWSLNAGLMMMLLMSLLPIGIIQAYASIKEGLWYARSEAFMQQPLLQTLRWWRMLGDSIFIIGAFALFAQVVIGLRHKESNTVAADKTTVPAE